jgi:hypothetical protein
MMDRVKDYLRFVINEIAARGTRHAMYTTYTIENRAIFLCPMRNEQGERVDKACMTFG